MIVMTYFRYFRARARLRHFGRVSNGAVAQNNGISLLTALICAYIRNSSGTANTQRIKRITDWFPPSLTNVQDLYR